MNPTELHEVLAALKARPPSPADPSIDGMKPSLVLEPDRVEMAQKALALCYAEELAVVPLGGGTRAHLGNLPSRLDVYLKTTRLDAIEAYEPRDLTISVQAGARLQEVQDSLGPEGQFLPSETPRPSAATIGGILALGETGFRRLPGSRPRDLLLGCEALLADGRRIHTGGRVVKNVAGYELGKLFVGSAGTLGVLTRAHLRVQPLPETARTLIGGWGSPAEAASVLSMLQRQPSGPQALAVADASLVAHEVGGGWAVCARFEGLEEDVRAAVDFTRRTWSASELEAKESEALWSRLREFPDPRTHPALPLVLRGQVPPVETLRLAERWSGLGVILGSPYSGVLHCRGDDPEILPRLFRETRAVGGNVVFEAGPVELKSQTDVYGELPGGFPIMERIKRRLDPKAILSPGRFVGRL